MCYLNYNLKFLLRKVPILVIEMTVNNFISQEGKDWPQILAIIIAGLGPITTGILYAWSSPSAIQILNDNQTYHITEAETSYFTVLPPIGMICAGLGFFKLTDILGRKKTLLLLAVPQLTCWLIIIFATNVYAFYVSRVIAGIGDAALFASLPVYVGEISTPKVRGFWGNFNTFCHYGGQFIITVIGSYLSVQKTAIVCIALPVIFVILFAQMPESPYYLIKKGKDENAKHSLRWLRRKDDVEQDFTTMKADVERQISESGTWKDLIAIKSNRRALLAGIFLRFSQMLGGISSFATYTQPIFQKAGGNVSPQTSSMIFLGLCFVLNFFGSAVVAKFGRRKSYFWSPLGCGVILLITSIYFFLDHYNITDLSNFHFVPLAGMVIYMIFFAFGMGVVPTLMLGELFSASIKGKALCIMNIVFGLALFVSNFMFNILNNNIGLYAPFLVFAICCLASAFLALYVVPETKGKTLEEIQQSLKSKKISSAKKIADSC